MFPKMNGRSPVGVTIAGDMSVGEHIVRMTCIRG
jgi:hypothetical protein